MGGNVWSTTIRALRTRGAAKTFGIHLRICAWDRLVWEGPRTCRRADGYFSPGVTRFATGAVSFNCAVSLLPEKYQRVGGASNPSCNGAMGGDCDNLRGGDEALTGSVEATSMVHQLTSDCSSVKFAATWSYRDFFSQHSGSIPWCLWLRPSPSSLRIMCDSADTPRYRCRCELKEVERHRSMRS